MRSNLRLWATLGGCHALLVLGVDHLPQGMTPWIAGSLYLPLWVFSGVGLPVFHAGGGGGWASPNVLGWALLVVVWGTVWWCVVRGAQRFLQSRAGRLPPPS